MLDCKFITLLMGPIFETSQKDLSKFTELTNTFTKFKKNFIFRKPYILTC